MTATQEFVVPRSMPMMSSLRQAVVEVNVLLEAVEAWRRVARVAIMTTLCFLNQVIDKPI